MPLNQPDYLKNESVVACKRIDTYTWQPKLCMYPIVGLHSCALIECQNPRQCVRSAYWFFCAISIALIAPNIWLAIYSSRTSPRNASRPSFNEGGHLGAQEKLKQEAISLRIENDRNRSPLWATMVSNFSAVVGVIVAISGLWVESVMDFRHSGIRNGLTGRPLISIWCWPSLTRGDARERGGAIVEPGAFPIRG